VVIKTKSIDEDEVKNTSVRGLPGIAVDAHGGGVIDPTENVLYVIRAESRYQDAMREMSQRLEEAKIDGLNRVSEFRAAHVKEIASAESLRVNEQARLIQQYEERLGLAEAKRIDAIRAVDVNAVAVASQRASDQASVLATQVSQTAEQLRTQVAQSAEALRSLVATTAATAQTTLQQLVGGLSARITTLEQAQYEGKGKSAYADPQLAELLTKVEVISRTQQIGAGKSEGVGTSWQVMVAIVGIGIAAAAIFIPMLMREAPTVSPQVIYAPAPAVAQPKTSP
jgi:cobalamin biosynthesis Mg chelatase CobN